MTNPFVSVLCPTYERQRLLPVLIQQYIDQDYPAERRELLILDDSATRSRDFDSKNRFQKCSNDKSIRYEHVTSKMPIGQKRNWLLNKARGDIIVWMDDDDVYTKDRISKSVRVLTSDSSIDVIGVKSTVFYHVDTCRFSFVRHRRPNYTCNNILAHWRSLNSLYDDADTIGEEKHFTNMFNLKAFRFDGIELCVHMCHEKNTAQKNLFFKMKSPYKGHHLLSAVKRKCNWEVLKKIEGILKNKRDKMHNIFWINLKKDKDRRAFMEKEFAKIDDKFKAFRFEALCPSTLPPEKYICNNDSLTISSKEEICCMSSHVDLIKFASRNVKSDAVIFVMEDDMQIKKESFERLDEIIDAAPSDWEILQLHHLRLDCRRTVLRYENTIDDRWVRWKRGFFSTGFYAIRSSVLTKILDTFYNHKEDKFDYRSISGAIQADNVIYRPFRTYTSTHNFVSTNVSFKSNIQKCNRNKFVRQFEVMSDRMFPL